MIQKILVFLKTDIWKIRTRHLPKWKALGINSIRVILWAIRDFVRDKCTVEASALTYYTLLTIVPVLAMAFGVAQGFGFEQNLERQILEQFKGMFFTIAISCVFGLILAAIFKTKRREEF